MNKREKNYIFIVTRNIISLVNETHWTTRGTKSCHSLLEVLLLLLCYKKSDKKFS